MGSGTRLIGRTGIARRIAVAACLAVATCLSCAGGVGADTGDGSDRVFVPQLPFTYPAGHVCAFAVQVTPVDDKEYIVRDTTEPDGTIVQRITGHLTATLTNLANGHAVTRNFSAAGTLTQGADGSLKLESEGPAFYSFGLRTQARLGLPGIDIVDGHAVFTIAPTGRVAFSVTGHQTDGCALIA